jgi:catechol 2,3-dioxygenase-like lactoylglutathione lyase family enzyme
MRYDAGIGLGRWLAVARQLPQIIGCDALGKTVESGLFYDPYLLPTMSLNFGSQCNDRPFGPPGLDHRTPRCCTDFYTHVLGMQLEKFIGGTPKVQRMAFKYGNQKINLHIQGSALEPKAHLLVLGVLDLCFIAFIPLERVIEHLKEKNWPIAEGPVMRTGATQKIFAIYVRDPDFNLIEVSEVARSSLAHD